MDSNSLFNIFHSKDKQSPKSRRSFSVMLICFLTSTFLWALIMLSKNYIAHVRFHLAYENIPSGKMITNPLPRRIEFLINASGLDLLSYRLKSTDNKISINVNDNIDDHNRIADNVYRVSTKNLVSEFTEQLKRDVNIQSVIPDSIEFNFSGLLTKKVALRSDIKINFGKQFDATADPHLVPDSILVSGPLSYLDTLRWVRTADTTFNDVKTNLNQLVPLKFDNNISSEVKSVRFFLSVEKFTEGSIQVPLQTINTVDNQKLKIFPDKVKVNYIVALSNYEKITEAQFNTVIDASEITKGSNKLKVELLKAPKEVKILTIEPEKVEYIILK